MAIAILAIPPELALGPLTVLAGFALIAAGELIRLWAVQHIGTISRTRSDRLGPLIDDGPFALVRNPLYLGNILLWVGFALAARVVWLAPVIALLLGVEYHAIVRWEEALLEARLGDSYRQYKRQVPRWFPRARPSTLRQAQGRPEHSRGATGSGRAESAGARNVADPLMVSLSNHERFSWRETLFSERGTLLAIVAGYLLLLIKARF